MKGIKIANTKELTREEWLEVRRQGIGGSDAAALIGLSPYKSAVAVWQDKLGLVQSDEPGESAYWGNILEDIVAKEFSKRTGLKIQRYNFMLRHPEHPFMLANLDRVIVDPDNGWGLLECKTADKHFLHIWEDGNVPEQYQVQVHHYLAVTGFDYAYIAVLVGGNRFMHFRIDKDPEVEAYLIEKESEFWQLVETKEMPPVDGSASCTEAIKMLYPSALADSITDLGEDHLPLLQEYKAAGEAVKAAEAHKDEIGNQLKTLLGNAEIGMVGKAKVKWGNVETNRFNEKKFKEERPHLWLLYTEESSYRRLSVSIPKPKKSKKD